MVLQKRVDKRGVKTPHRGTGRKRDGEVEGTERERSVYLWLSKRGIEKGERGGMGKVWTGASVANLITFTVTQRMEVSKGLQKIYYIATLQQKDPGSLRIQQPQAKSKI